MRMRNVVVAALAAGSLAFAPAVDVTGALPPATSSIASGITEQIAGQTIVVLHDSVRDVPRTAFELLAPYGVRPFHVYQHALRGFAVDLDAAALAALADDPRVASIEADREVRTAAQTTPRGVQRVDADHAATIGDGSSVSVDIAIIDTGIANHGDLNIVERRDCTDRSFEASVEYVEYLLFGDCKDGGTDSNGHGTHVAGIAGARDNDQDVVGVAPGARLWSIKVLTNASGGSLSDVIAGVDEVTRNADVIEVANISLVADGTSSAMNEAVQGAVDAGVVVVVAAGNDGKDASNVTPANAPAAITVGAITDLDGRPGGDRSGSCQGDADDTFASYSNHGSALDILAPGSCIVSTSRGGGAESMSGTSMAAPHVAGAAALRIVQTSRGPSAGRADAILDDLLARAAREGTSCGYRSTPRTNARLLDLVKGC